MWCRVWLGFREASLSKQPRLARLRQNAATQQTHFRPIKYRQNHQFWLQLCCVCKIYAKNFSFIFIILEASYVCDLT